MDNNDRSTKIPPYTAGLSEKFFKEYLEYIKTIDKKSIEKCKETIQMLKIPEIDEFGLEKSPKGKKDRKDWC